MKVYLDRVIRVRPEMNPDLRLHAEVATRPGISHGPPYVLPDNDLALRSGLRAIEHALRSNGNLPPEEPFEPVFTA